MDSLRLAGVELYFEDLSQAKAFYERVLGLNLSDESPGHYAKFATGAAFVCLERKGSEPYPSSDKAVLFFEVEDLPAAVRMVGSEHIVQQHAADGRRPAWAVLHDPEGHSILLLGTRCAQ